jgi:hypothetical protein
MKSFRSQASFLAITLLLAGCERHETIEEPLVETQMKPLTTDTNSSRFITANKQLDKNGNIISYDSAYLHFFTAKGRTSLKLGIDTLFSRFKNLHSKTLCGELNQSFTELFLNDTLCRYDFLNKDYFSKRFELNLQRIYSLIMRMDSVKNNYVNIEPSAETYRPVTPVGKK